MQCMNIPVDKLSFEHPTYRFKYFKGRKIRRLKLKYSRNKRDWYAREEIALLKRMLFWVKKGYNKFGATFLKGYYKKWYYKIFKFEKDNNKKDILLRVLRNNYKFLFYIISFFAFSLKGVNPLYPKKLFWVRDMRFFLNIYFLWFIHRPIFFQFGKFVELLVSRFDYNLNTKVNLFLIDNASVNAAFLARYIGMALKLKFRFKDIVIPIRKNLKKLMYIKKLKSRKVVKHYSKELLSKVLTRIESFKHWMKNRLFIKLLNLFFRLRLQLLNNRTCFLRKNRFKNYFFFISNNLNFLRKFNIFYKIKKKL